MDECFDLDLTKNKRDLSLKPVGSYLVQKYTVVLKGGKFWPKMLFQKCNVSEEQQNKISGFLYFSPDSPICSFDKAKIFCVDLPTLQGSARLKTLVP